MACLPAPLETDGVLCGEEVDGFIRASFDPDKLHIRAVATLFGSRGVISFEDFQRMLRVLDGDFSLLTSKKLIALASSRWDDMDKRKREALRDLRTLEDAIVRSQRQAFAFGSAQPMKALRKMDYSLEAFRKKMSSQRGSAKERGGGEEEGEGHLLPGIVKEGFLEKRGALNTSFKSRFLRLFTNGVLRYYKGKSERHLKQMRGEIHLHNARVKVPEDSNEAKDEGYIFQLTADNGRAYVFRTDLAWVRTEWITEHGLPVSCGCVYAHVIQHQIDSKASGDGGGGSNASSSSRRTNDEEEAGDDEDMDGSGSALDLRKYDISIMDSSRSSGWLEMEEGGDGNSTFRRLHCRLRQPSYTVIRRAANGHVPAKTAQRKTVLEPLLVYFEDESKDAKQIDSLVLAKVGAFCHEDGASDHYSVLCESGREKDVVGFGKGPKAEDEDIGNSISAAARRHGKTSKANAHRRLFYVVATAIPMRIRCVFPTCSKGLEKGEVHLFRAADADKAEKWVLLVTKEVRTFRKYSNSVSKLKSLLQQQEKQDLSKNFSPSGGREVVAKDNNGAAPNEDESKPAVSSKRASQEAISSTTPSAYKRDIFGPRKQYAACSHTCAKKDSHVILISESKAGAPPSSSSSSSTSRKTRISILTDSDSESANEAEGISDDAAARLIQNSASRYKQRSDAFPSSDNCDNGRANDRLRGGRKRPKDVLLFSSTSSIPVEASEGQRARDPIAAKGGGVAKLRQLRLRRLRGLEAELRELKNDEGHFQRGVTAILEEEEEAKESEERRDRERRKQQRARRPSSLAGMMVANSSLRKSLGDAGSSNTEVGGERAEEERRLEAAKNRQARLRRQKQQLERCQVKIGELGEKVRSLQALLAKTRDGGKEEEEEEGGGDEKERRDALLRKKEADLVRTRLEEERRLLRQQSERAMESMRAEMEQKQSALEQAYKARLESSRKAWERERERREDAERRRAQEEATTLRNAHENEMKELQKRLEAAGQANAVQVEEEVARVRREAEASLETVIKTKEEEMEQRLRAVRKEAEDAEAKKIEEARREATSEIQRQLADYKQSADSSRREHGRLLEEQTRRAAERERQLQDEIGEMRERMQHSETAEKRLLSVESELTEVKKAAEEARKQAHREASEREGKARLEMEKMQLKIDAAEAREREETRRLAVAQDTLAKEREVVVQSYNAMRVKTHQQIATDQQKLEWKKREALLREEVLRLGESLKREHAESEQLRKGQQQLKESATNLAAKFKEKEARMQKNFEKMKARVKEKVWQINPSNIRCVCASVCRENA
eukprot:jgi/Bigna1/73402/fgenesh1_pg.24_\